MKYLKKFPTHAEYAAYINGQSAVLPNVSFCSDNRDVHYNPYVRKSQVGDILYFDGTELKSVPYTDWESSLGTPIAVCVIPQAHNVYGNNKAGWVSIGNDASSVWSYSMSVKFSAYKQIPVWANDGQGLTGIDTAGYLPSDRFNTVLLFGDNTKGYNVSSQMSPCPFLPDGGRNPDYYATELNGSAITNPFADFAGKTKTATMAQTPGDYTVAAGCANYSTVGTQAGDWFLPAAGELGYIMPNFAAINAAITACGGTRLNGSTWYSTSTEADASHAYALVTGNGKLEYNMYKGGNCGYRPFLQY